MKKRAIIVAGGFVLVAALGAVTAGEDQELTDEEMKELIDAVEAACEDADCDPGGGPLTDEQVDALGFDSLLIADAWGICVIEDLGSSDEICVCTEPEPPSPPTAPLPDQTAIYVGLQYGIAVYDTLACKGLYYEESGWTWTVAGGCRKGLGGSGGLEHLEVLGNQSTAIDEDNLVLVREAASAGDCGFADWWSSANHWDSVTARGRGGRDDVRGSPQGDELHGEIVRGYEGDDDIHLQKVGITNPTAYGGDDDDTILGTTLNDYLYGESGYDALDGNSGASDYCNCGADNDPAASNCDTIVSCNP